MTEIEPTLAARRASFGALALALLSSTAIQPAVAREAADRATRAALSLEAHPARGAVEFGRLCASCHGARGQGDAVRAIPVLAGQRFRYLVRQLADFRASRRESARMHAVVSRAQLRGPQDWADIAAFLSQATPPPVTQTGSGAHVALGRGIFHEQCASCHRYDARGDDDGLVPSLRNQHYSYLVGQMHRLAAGERHGVDENLVLFLRSFDERDADAVADYLSRLRGPGGGRAARADTPRR